MLAALLIAVATAAAYANSFDGIFVFDDEPAIQENAHVRQVWPLTESMGAPPDSTLAGRPIASLSFALDYWRAGGHSLAGYHATNLAIHIAAALLLFGVVRRTLRVPRLRPTFGGAATPLAAMTALLWALHPVQTGAVTYIVQRVESMMGLFYLATLYCAIRAVEAEPQARRRWLGASVACCAIGMGVKESMATAPLIVFAWDYFFVERSGGRPRWFHLALGACWLILAVLVAGGPRSFSVGFHFEDWPWWRYLFTQAGVVAHYLRLSFVPWPLVLDYEWPPASFAQALAPGVVIVALLAATAWAAIRSAPAAFAGIWFFVILAPTSSVLPIATEVAAEHRLYLPLAAPVALVLLGAFAVARKLHPTAGGALRVVGFTVVAVAAGACGFLTHERNEDYRDYDRIWSQTVVHRPRNSRALNNYATSLIAQGRFAEAEERLRTAVDVSPAFAEAQANLGVALCAQGRFDEGIPYLQRAIALRPDYLSAYRNLAEAYASEARMAEAVANYAHALALQPDDVDLLNRSAWILATTPDDTLRNPGRARELAERAVRLTERRDPVSLDSLAASLAANGEFGAAVRVVTEALAAARARNDVAILPELEVRLNLYRSGRPFRDRA